MYYGKSAGSYMIIFLGQKSLLKTKFFLKKSYPFYEKNT